MSISIHAWVRGCCHCIVFAFAVSSQVRNLKSYIFYIPVSLLQLLIFSFSPCESRLEIHFLPWSLISFCPGLF